VDFVIILAAVCTALVLMAPRTGALLGAVGGASLPPLLYLSEDLVDGTPRSVLVPRV
jgi:hypothetical protein